MVQAREPLIRMYSECQMPKPEFNFILSSLGGCLFVLPANHSHLCFLSVHIGYHRILCSKYFTVLETPLILCIVFQVIW